MTNKDFRSYWYTLHTSVVFVYCDGLFIKDIYTYNIAQLYNTMTTFKASHILNPSIHKVRADIEQGHPFEIRCGHILVLTQLPYGKSNYKWVMRYYIDHTFVSEYIFPEVYPLQPKTTDTVKEAYKLMKQRAEEYTQI